MIDVEKVLKGYKEKKSYVATTLIRIEAWKYAIGHPETWYKDYIPPSSPLGMPGKPKGSPSVPIENYVIGKTLNEEIIKDWIRDDESRIFLKKLEVEQIEKALECLTSLERFIIDCKCFDNMNWRDIENNVNNKFRPRNYITISGLRKVKLDAINKLRPILEPFYKQFKLTI